VSTTAQSKCSPFIFLFPFGVVALLDGDDDWNSVLTFKFSRVGTKVVDEYHNEEEEEEEEEGRGEVVHVTIARCTTRATTPAARFVVVVVMVYICSRFSCV
jgi:preprotein translocase subunit SecF